MERKMSKHWPGFKVLCIVLLLGFGNGAFGSIKADNLQKIMKYITGYGVKNVHYAVAVKLDQDVCKHPTQQKLQAALPKNVMEEMHKAIDKSGGIYDPNPVGNVVAARPAGKGKTAKHAEWRLLNGGENSPTGKMLNNKHDSCLIFFSKLSPCTDRCLNLSDTRNFVQWINPLFNKLGQDSSAFVFESVYSKDYEKETEAIVDAWKKIKHAPLFRCDNNECIQCFDNNGKLNQKCLHKK